MMTNDHDSNPPASDTLPSDLRDTPFLETSQTLSPRPPLTFSTVIEDDHSRINAIAINLGRQLSRSLQQSTLTQRPLHADVQHLRQTQLSLLRELTWRLIRHDISENLIMRPAFAQHLGREGADFGRHDREDHERARTELLSLYDAFEKLPLSWSDTDQDVGTTREAFGALAGRYKELMRELAAHMKVESGSQIPRLEGMLSRGESEGLARRYLRTYVLEPELMVNEERVWIGGVGEYVRERRERFEEVWRVLEWSGESEVVEQGKKGERL